jgi:hypothetical protein
MWKLRWLENDRYLQRRFDKEPDLGIPFQKAYNMDTLEPTPEWEAMYRKVKAECIELGIPLDSH